MATTESQPSSAPVLSAAPPTVEGGGADVPENQLPPPFIAIAGVPNFRSLTAFRSTLPAYPNHEVRTTLLYRSAQFSNITPQAAQKLTSDLEVRTIFDLRSEIEIKNMSSYAPVPMIEGVERVETPVFLNNEWEDPKMGLRAWYEFTDPIDPELGYSRGFVEGYKRIATSGAEGGAYARILKRLLENVDSDKSQGNGEARDDEKETRNGAIAIHCTAGKDRTGVLVAVLLKLLGVEDELIAEEYSLTEQGMGSWRDVIIEKLVDQHVLKKNDQLTPEEREDKAQEVREKARLMVSAKKVNMIGFLKWMNGEKGGVENYLKRDVGMVEEELEALKRIFLVEIKEAVPR